MEKLLKYAAYTLPFGDRIDVVVEGPFSVHKSQNFPQNSHDTNPQTRAKLDPALLYEVIDLLPPATVQFLIAHVLFSFDFKTRCIVYSLLVHFTVVFIQWARSL